MPAAQRVQMHLAGGYFDDAVNMYIDSHSRPIPESVFELYRYALRIGAGKIEAVFIERDQDFPDAKGWRAEVRRVRQIAEETLGRATTSTGDGDSSRQPAKSQQMENENQRCPT
jgi:uncharacterized protein (UPF0276 family)